MPNDTTVKDSVRPNVTENENSMSKENFSYLSSRMSPMPGAWTIPENTTVQFRQQDFDHFLESENEDPAAVPTFGLDKEGKYSGDMNISEVQGILKEGRKASDRDQSIIPSSSSEFTEDDFESVESFPLENMDKEFLGSVSPTEGLQFHSIRDVDQNSSSSDISNTTSSLLDSSVPTQDLKNMILENSLNDPEILNADNKFDDSTPIVPQNGFAVCDKTPTASFKDEEFDNEDLILSSEAINEIFDDGHDRLFPAQNTRIQSVSSSVYSEFPANGLNGANSQRLASMSSSVYSQVPGRKSAGINEGLRNFRISSFKPTLHKHLSRPLPNESINEASSPSLKREKEDDLQIPPRSRRSYKNSTYVNKYQLVAENEALDFTSGKQKETQEIESRELKIKDDTPSETKDSIQPKTRVSVLNQSLYQGHYNSKTGAPSQPNMPLSSIVSSKNVESLLATPSTSNDSPDLSFTSSYNERHSVLTDNSEDEDDASALFVTSLYAFSSDALESENDSSICLSFDQDEIAFTYNLDDSGWGEVTLLSSLKRGWVPMNYFRSTVASDITKGDIRSMSCKELTQTRAPLRLLLKYAGTFLLNPQSKPVYIGGELRGYTFDVECFNGITDGLRRLLIDTNCISRSNSFVQTKPVVRKMRKKLLRGWADLIGKIKDYMGTIATPKIEYLQLLTFHLLQKAITFLDIWGLEQDRLDEGLEYQKANRLSLTDNNTKLAWNSLESVSLDIMYLDRPPVLSYRVNEIYNQLLTYLCLIAGRIDLVEHNPKSFTVVGIVIGHINLLVNEYFFIIKILKNTLNESENEEHRIKNVSKYGKLGQQMNLKGQLSILDSQTEKLRQLVDELNTYIKIIHDTSFKSVYNQNEGFSTHPSISRQEQGDNLYFYSKEGGAVVVCACKMIEFSSNAYKILKNMVNITDDLVLPNGRKYPNYLEMSIKPEDFIKQCSTALANDSNIQKQVKNYKKLSMTAEQNGNNIIPNRSSNRYSVFKTGNSTDVLLSSSGLDFLSHFESESSQNSPFLNGQEFEDNTKDITDDYEFNAEQEILRTEKGNNIIGASFRALVFLLTDENNPPDYFFTSTFFLTFRIFADGSQLLDALIKRFDVKNNYKNNVSNCNSSISESKIRSRRKLVVKSFQFWLESYWKCKADYVLLAPIMNFFNEGMKPFLPIESYQLLVTASKLIGHPPIENITDKLNYYNNISNNQQLLPRKISSKLNKKTLSRLSLGAENNGLLGEIEAYNSFLDDIDTYELKEVENQKAESNIRASLNLNLDIELKNSNSNSVLLTKQQISMIRMVVMSYRRMLGTHWNSKHKENQFEPMDTQTLIESWWSASQESWKILNDDLTLLNFNGLEIAKQLTLIENKMFCSIQAGELLNQNFTTKKLHLNLSPNIQKSILFTNLLSDYVIESILKPGLQMRQRIHAIKCWLKIAISCLYLRNFNSLASIMTSLQSFLITRITKIWEGLSDKYEELFQYLASIIHPNRNYNTYREKLKDFLATNLQEKIDIPTVPYLSLFLQDLTFVVDGNPNYRTNTKSFLDEKLINIDKYFKITEIISDIQTLQVSYKDVGELGTIYNDKNTDIVRSETIKNLKSQFDQSQDVSFADMFDITGVPVLQELILLEIWKVKQTNARDDDRSWKLSCAIQPREKNK
ncbi:hypothetical protein PMKS-003175 [Pichia membranifaciens]|uniref:Bud site selection protein 5 n=1 Tax=Pichia membranifaciens TaxID=4926 RepID=A0A1Q2YJX4_9ASCO|nr:hypothetical protein PMKS-003175 [Pichia membranifaciens]